MTQTNDNLLGLLVAALAGDELALRVMPDLIKDSGHENAGQLLTELFAARKQLALARDVYEKVYQACDSFEEENVGADLAYLLGAILKDEVCAWPGNRPFVRVLRQLYDKTHPIWTFIELSE